MPQLPSMRKRLRQAQVRTERNRAKKKAMRLAIRKVLDAARANDADALAAAIPAAQKAIDKCAKVNAIHKNMAARRKSRMMKRVASLMSSG
ncbi:MAG: 30S ribosomal protein S20 [Armatimonadetes bacterium]|nr:30S ribosomal protein S20 [Armatimonadota bacterium]